MSPLVIGLRRALVLLALLVGALPAFAMESRPAEAPQAAAQRILADPKFQRQIPGRAKVVADQPSARPQPRREPQRWRISLPAFTGLAAIAGVLFWALVAVIAVVLLVWAVNLLSPWLRRSGEAAGEAVPEAELPGVPQIEPTLEEANRLARDGHFGEAVHMLLLAAIRRLAERGKRVLQPHQTSRELLRALPLGPESRQAFRDLVVTVEEAHFGGLEVGPADFERSVARYRSLTEGRPNGS